MVITHFLWSCGNTVKTQAHIWTAFVFASTSPISCQRATHVASFEHFVSFVRWPTQWWHIHTLFLLMHRMTTYVGQFGVAGPYLLSSQRLTSFKTPMMGKIFISPRPPTQTNLAMCSNLVSYSNEQVCEPLLKSGIVQ